ncbi:MAG: hypothetical protein MZV70_01555 [Desulfobacterales bacterium]|nr:hypothetical protein [Desulfobacterales bacterium]
MKSWLGHTQGSNGFTIGAGLLDMKDLAQKETPERIFEMADKALERVKNSGRKQYFRSRLKFNKFVRQDCIINMYYC